MLNSAYCQLTHKNINSNIVLMYCQLTAIEHKCILDAYRANITKKFIALSIVCICFLILCSSAISMATEPIRGQIVDLTPDELSKIPAIYFEQPIAPAAKADLNTSDLVASHLASEGISPEEAAENIAMSKYSGIPVNVFASDKSRREEVKKVVNNKMAYDQNWDDVAKRYPELATVISDPNFLAATKNNFESLSGLEWWLLILISLLLTWGIGLIPPLLIRFKLFKRPLGMIEAITISGILHIINLIIFITIIHSQNKTHGALMLVAIVSYYILRRK